MPYMELSLTKMLHCLFNIGDKNVTTYKRLEIQETNYNSNQNLLNIFLNLINIYLRKINYCFMSE